MTTIPGDPFGSKKEPKVDPAPEPREVKRFHTNADTDSSQQAQHHTLGIKHDQASPGDHDHNGVNSRRIMETMALSGSKGGNVALANLITLLANEFGLDDNTT